jgi:hypothetical protein
MLLLLDDPARLALRMAYIAILAWPLPKQTTVNVKPLAGSALTVELEPQSIEEQRHDDSNPNPPIM